MGYNLPASFYPTPPALVEKMLAFIDFKRCFTFLEPSAGDGAIVWGIAERTNTGYRESTATVDCIELDETLRALLRARFGSERHADYQDKFHELDRLSYHDRSPDQTRQMNEYRRMMELISFKARLVHDDFLTFAARKRYDAIIMNPPFENGDAHLLRALDIMQDGGQIVCLLNAETIRNPYTLMRQALLQRLTTLEAQIQFLPGEFETRDTRRKTSVEVALINITIPASRTASFIFDRLRKAKEQAADTPPPESLIRMGDKVVEMVEQFDFETECGLQIIREYEGLRPYMMEDYDQKGYSSCILTLTVGTDGNSLQHCDINKYLRKTRLKYWRALLSVPEFVGMLTSNLQDEFRDTINKMADYDFTEFNIRQVLMELQSKLSQGVEDTILNIFDQLTAEYSWYPESKTNIHYFNGWRTNQAHKIGKKSIIPTYGVFSSYAWSRQTFSTTEAYKCLADIEKVLNYLDDGTTGEIDLSHVLRAASNGGQTRGIFCKYFTVDLFKKGTCHIKFHNQDVIDRLNIYGSRRRRWLPPNYGRERYENMTPEEQAVVDDFQGQEAYAKVCADPGLWLVEPQGTLMLGAGKANTGS